MNQEPNVFDHNSRKQRLLTWGTLILLLVFGGGYYVYDLTSQSPLAEIEGDVYLSLIPGLPERFIKPLGVYKTTPEGDLVEVFVRSLEQTDVETERMLPVDVGGEISPDGNTMAMISADRRVNASGEVLTQDQQVALLDLETKNIEKITDTNTTKANPAWSPSGDRVAFMALSAEAQEDADSVNAWLIQVVNTQTGDVRTIGSGVQPHFSPNGEALLYMRADGLHLVDLETSRDQLVWEMNDGETYRGMKIGVSDSKMKLAWGVPQSDKIIVANINTWEPFNITITDRISARAFWPVFSPDGEHIAFEEVSTPEHDDPKLVVYNLAEDKKDTAIDLSEFYQESMWVIDWR